MIGNHMSIHYFWQSLHPVADSTSLKGLLIHTFYETGHMHTDTWIPTAWNRCNRLLVCFMLEWGGGSVQMSAVGPLARLFLPPCFQDHVPPVGGVMVWYEWDVEGSEERRGSERRKTFYRVIYPSLTFCEHRTKSCLMQILHVLDNWLYMHSVGHENVRKL